MRAVTAALKKQEGERDKMSETDPSMYLRRQDNQQLLEHTKMFDSKKWLWIPDEEEAFKSACVKKQKGDKVVLELVDGSVRNDSIQMHLLLYLQYLCVTGN